MSPLLWRFRVISLLLAALTSGRPCQFGLQLVNKTADGGGRQLQLRLPETECHCGTPSLYILVCRAARLCDERERFLKNRSWHNLQLPPLTADQNVTVYYSGWYGARSGNCSKTLPLWVEGIHASSWNAAISTTFKKNSNRDEGLCISVLVAKQFDQLKQFELSETVRPNSNQSNSNPHKTYPAFPKLRLCLYEMQTIKKRDCRVLEFPQPSEELFCGGSDGLKTAAVYEATVCPYVTSVCWNVLPGCPRRSWQLVLPALLTEEAAELSPAPRHLSWTVILYIGAVVAVLTVTMSTVACRIHRRMRRALPAPAILGPAEMGFAPAAGATALLVARGPASGADALQLRRLSDRLVAHGIKVLSLQDRETLSHLQRHPSLADALSRPLLHRAFLLFIAGGDGGDGGGVQSRLSDSLLQHVRSSHLAYDYQRVFVLSLGGAALAPPLEDVAQGRLFRVEDDTDLLIEHLSAAAAARSSNSDSVNGNSGSDEPLLPNGH